VDADGGGDVDFDEFIEWWEDDSQNTRLKKKLRGASSVAAVRKQLKKKRVEAQANPMSVGQAVKGAPGLGVAGGIAASVYNTLGGEY
jgi:hypothetical protein